MLKSLRGMAFGLAVGLLGWGAQAQAEERLRHDHPDTYYVKQGDTLWDISSAFLRNPWQWPELWHHNPQIDNPHLIYPGDLIRLAWVDGEPRLVHEQAVKLAPDADGVVRLTPEARVLPLATAIPAIPLTSIQSFLKEALVLSREELDEAPYLVGGTDRRVIYGTGDTVYARDIETAWADLAPEYGIYRVGGQYVDPDSQEILGYEALQIGNAGVVARDEEVLTMRVLSASEDLRAKDRVMLSPERRMQALYYPAAPEEPVEGQIIRMFGRLSSVARHDVVVINRGAREGLREGHVLDVFQRGDQIKDPVRNERIRLPEVKAGTLVLFRVFEKVSYALVIESTRPIYMTDVVKNPVAVQ